MSNWKQHPEHDNFLISDEGNILRKKRGKRTPNYIQKTMRKIMLVETGEVFEGIGDCARKINGNPGHIHECLNGTRKTHHVYHFKYVESGDQNV